MASRSTLKKKLQDILGSSYVYYNPPENMKLKYPCIIYSLDDVKRSVADNRGYALFHRYLVTLIDYRPDNPARDKLLELPASSFVRSYKADNLEHYTINMYW